MHGPNVAVRCRRCDAGSRRQRRVRAGRSSARPGAVSCRTIPSAGVVASGSTASASSGSPAMSASEAGRRPRNVCTMCFCQPGTVCTRTSSKPAAGQALRERVHPVEPEGAAPQIAVEVRGSRTDPADRDDHAPADRGPDDAAAHRVAHRVLVDRDRRARPQQAVDLAQRRVAMHEVAQQVGGQDPVVGARRCRSSPGSRRCRARSAPSSGHVLRRACASISTEASTAVMRASGAISTSAAVDAPVPQPRSSSCSPAPRFGRPIRFADIRRCSW